MHAHARATEAGNISLWSVNSDGITVDTVRPRLTNAVAYGYLAVDVTFSEQVRYADVLANYSCTGGLKLLGVWPLSSTKYRVYISAQTPRTNYTLTVAAGVKDRAGNAMDPAGRSGAFLGGAKTGATSWWLYR